MSLVNPFRAAACIVTLGILLPAAHVAAEGAPAPVVRLADGAVVGDSSLVRTPNRLNAVVRTSDLDPGSAVTVWWRIYNRPRFCATDPCTPADLSNPRVRGSQLHATGIVVEDASGEATLVATAYRTASRVPGGTSFADSLLEGFLSGPGLRRPLDAEIQLVILSHGRALGPEAEDAFAQLTTPDAAFTDCEGDADPAGRSFRCGALQVATHQP